MPTVNVTQIADEITWYKSWIIPVVYNGKRYIVNFSGIEGLSVLNITDKELHSFGQGDTFWRNSKYLGHWYKNGILKVLFVYMVEGSLIYNKAVIDLSSMTATRTELKQFSLSWLDRAECLMHGTTIPPRFVGMVDWANGDVHYIDVFTGSIKDIDLGQATYENEYRLSHKWIVKHDDIYMAAGKHLSGSTHEVWKVFSATRNDLGFSTGGGSPIPAIFGMAVFSDAIYIPVTSGGVVGADNDLAILDETFTRIATIDLSNVLGIRAAFPFGNFIAKKTDGGYYAIMGSIEDVSIGTFRVVVKWVELDSSFNVVSSLTLLDISAGNTNTHSTVCNLYPDYSDITSAPVIDIQRKMIYAYYRDHVNNVGYLMEIDISDVWDNIDEFNQRNWFIGLGKIPTMLSLTVTPM